MFLRGFSNPVTQYAGSAALSNLSYGPNSKWALLSKSVEASQAADILGSLKNCFGLDNSCLRMDEERLHREYHKAADDFTLLTDTKAQQEAKKQVEEFQRELRDRNVVLATFSKQSDEKFKTLQTKVESLTQAVQMMQDANHGKWKWIAPEQVATNPSQD